MQNWNKLEIIQYFLDQNYWLLYKASCRCHNNVFASVFVPQISFTIHHVCKLILSSLSCFQMLIGRMPSTCSFRSSVHQIWSPTCGSCLLTFTCISKTPWLFSKTDTGESALTQRPDYDDLEMLLHSRLWKYHFRSICNQVMTHQIWFIQYSH